MTTSFASLEATIVADLKAGVSWFETEAAEVGLATWNILKGAFIALEPAEASVLINLLTTVVTDLGSGKTIEDVETSALNTAKGAEVDVLSKAGSGIVQVIIAGIKAAL